MNSTVAQLRASLRRPHALRYRLCITDGSLLSAMGLPTPNLFTRGHVYHSVREWPSVQDMASAAATVMRLAGEWA